MVGAGAALVGTCYGLARFAYGLFLPELSTEFALDATISGVIGAGSYVGYCVAIVASLALTPRWGPRRVAVLAGVLATAGLTIVAVAPSAAVLAVGILLAGSSTGVASPPLAAAVETWMRDDLRDRAQTIVNAGTGLGVLLSGPVALVLLDQWRWAWAGFAVVAAVVTGWTARVIPRSTPEVDAGSPSAMAAPSGSANSTPTQTWLPPGALMLLSSSFLMGVISIAVWGFGRELLTSVGHLSTLGSALTWTVLGAAGILGAFGGDLVGRVGLSTSWVALMLIMGVGTTLLALAPSTYAVVLTAAALFGASYIGLTGVVLLWSTQLYPSRTSFGVGIAFFTIAAGQAVGAPIVGRLIESLDAPAVFFGSGALAVLGLVLRPGAAGPATQ